jgi:outer membrane protein assembly factor BamB
MSCTALFLLAAAAGATDWPQFRGPGGQGVAEETGLPVRWTKTENVRWKAALPGEGASSPVVAGGRVYVTACSGPRQDRLHVLCFDAQSGRRLWERRLWATGNTMCHPKTNMAAPTPAADGARVYALFATGDFACFGRDGDLLWYRSLVRDYPTFTNQVGMAASPVLWQDLLLVQLDNHGRESYLLGIERRTGHNRWRAERWHQFNWVTPLVYTHAGQTELLLQATPELISYDPETGKPNWTYKSPGLNQVAMPVAEGERIFVPGSEFLALRPTATDAAPKVVWKTSRLGTNLSSPLCYRGRIYAVNPAGVLNCADAATGNVLWQQRLKGPFAASPVAAGGHLYFMNEDGLTTVVKAGDKPWVVARNDLEESSLASPAVADGALFLRTDRHLYCVAGPDDETARLLKELKSAAHSPAAWNQLVARGPAALPRILEAMDTPDTAVANWLRTAFDRIVADSRKDGDKGIDVDALLAFIKEPKHHGRSRRLALEVVEQLRPGTTARLTPGWLDDPEFRYDAVDLLAKEAADLAGKGQKKKAKETYLRAFAACRDVPQAQRLATRLQALGVSVRLAEHFGFLTDWFLIGPFDGKDQHGFQEVYPPEQKVDLAAEYPGKQGAVRWKRYHVREAPAAAPARLALVNLVEPVGAVHDAVAYAYTALTVPADQEVEFRGSGDDNFIVWVNGQRVFGFEEYRNGIRFDRHRFRARLRAGVNRVLVKICQGPLDPTTNDGSWEFLLRMVDVNGKGIVIKSALNAKPEPAEK